MADRPIMIPMNVNPGGAGTGGGVAPKPETGQGPKGGEVANPGGGGPCEKYICSCSEINDKIEEYNDAVQALADELDNIKISDQLGELLDEINDYVVTIDAKDPKVRPPDDGDSCGCPQGMSAIISRKLGQKAAHLYAACCMDSGPDKPWDNEPGMLGPCGRDKDSAFWDLKLFSCPPIDISEGASNQIAIPKIKCVRDDTKKCKEAGVTTIKSDLDQPAAFVTIPDLENLGEASKQLTKIKDYLKTVINAANGSINLGGANGNLKEEACLTRLLHLICTHRINNPNRTPNNKSQQQCANAWPAYKGAKVKSFGNFLNCHQLMNDLANASLAFGHSKYAGQNRPEKNEKDAHSHNGVRDCEKNKVQYIVELFAPAGANPNAVVQQYLADLHAAFPGGCRDVDGGPITDYEIQKNVGCTTKDDCPCWGKENVTQTDGPPLSDADKQKIYQLNGQIETLQRENRASEREKTKLNADNEKLKEQLKKLPPVPSGPGGAPGMDFFEQVRLQAAIEANNNLITELDNDIAENREQIQDLQAEIDDIKGNPTFPGGSCLTVKYSYCAANSTPMEAGPNQPPGAPEGGGPGAGGFGGNAGQFHRNFFDLLNNIADQMGKNYPCPGQNPFWAMYDNCTGRDLDDPNQPQPGKNPYDPGNQKPPNSGPTLPPFSPCKENDNVRSVTGIWIPGNAQNPCPDNQSTRALCLQRIQRALKNWGTKSQRALDLLSPVEDIVSGLMQALASLNKAMKAINPPSADECGDVNTKNINKLLNDAKLAIEEATKALAKLKMLTDKLKEENE